MTKYLLIICYIKKGVLNMKKIILSIISIFIIITILIVDNSKVINKEDNNKIKVNNNLLSMMLETEANSGKYEMTTSSSWPTDGYVFNSSLSKCENGGKLSWDNENKKVIFEGNNIDKCYVYFDVYVPLRYISEVCPVGGNLSSCITNLANQSSPSFTSIYHHDGTLENGINDDSYRYAGGDYDLTDTGKATGATMLIRYNDSATTVLIDFYCNGTKQYVGYECSTSQTHYYLIKGDTTEYQTYSEALNAALEKGYLTKDNLNNFVCFGSTASPCPTDNLYRIIGVIDGKVKLIKYDYATSDLLGTEGDCTNTYGFISSYYKGSNYANVAACSWNYRATNTWSTSLLNKTNLNTNFINNIESAWANKISATTWKVGGNTYENIRDVIPSTAYQNEIVSPVTTNTTDNVTEYTAKIVLMYVSDYYYSASPSAWTLVGSNTSDSSKDYRAATSANWMHMGLSEYTISRSADSSDFAFFVSDIGYVHVSHVDSVGGVRPSFNLNSSVTYAGGTGSMSSPIRIN